MAKPHFRLINLFVLSLAIIVLAACGAASSTGTSMNTPEPQPSIMVVTATPMPAPIFSLESVQMTATALARMFGATSTPVSTLTNLELEQLHTRWLSDLETAAGFSHPVFV